MANQGTENITYSYSTNGGSSYSSSGEYYSHYRVQTLKIPLYDRTALDGTLDTRAFRRRIAMITIPAIVVLANESAIDTLKGSDFLKLTLSGQADFDGANEWRIDESEYEYLNDDDKGKFLRLTLSKKNVE